MDITSFLASCSATTLASAAAISSGEGGGAVMVNLGLLSASSDVALGDGTGAATDTCINTQGNISQSNKAAVHGTVIQYEHY